MGFSKGNYLTLRNLKNFYKPLNEGKSSSYSLIIRRALDLLDNRISSIRNTKDLYEESEVFNVLASGGKWERFKMTLTTNHEASLFHYLVSPDSIRKSR